MNGWLEGSCPNLGDLAVRGSKQSGRIRIFPVLGIGSEESSALFESGLESSKNPGAGAIVESRSVPKINMKNYAEIKIMPLDATAGNLGSTKGRLTQ